MENKPAGFDILDNNFDYFYLIGTRISIAKFLGKKNVKIDFFLFQEKVGKLFLCLYNIFL